MELTVKKFQDLYNISLLEMSDIDKSIALVECLTGLPTEKVEQMPIEKFDKICLGINNSFNITIGKPKQYINANGKWYKIHYEVSKLPVNAGRYVEVSSFSNDVINNLHKIMASICQPVKWSWLKMRFVEKEYSSLQHGVYATDMLNAKFSDCYNACVFFCKLFKELIMSLKDYLISETVSKGMSRESMETFMQNLKGVLDGFLPQSPLQNLNESH